MSSLEFDGHLRCANCIGSQCTLESRCDSCKDWSDDVMNRYLKHQASLKSKRESKRKRRLSKGNESKQLVKDSQGDSQQLGVNDSGSEASECVESSVSSFGFQSTVRELNDAWNARFESFQENLNASLDSSFSAIVADITNKFLAAPQRLPVSNSLGSRDSDPSLEAPQKAKRPGGNPTEQVTDGMPPRPGVTPATGSTPFPNVHPRQSVGESPGTSGLGDRQQGDAGFNVIPIDVDDNGDGDDDDEGDDVGHDDPSGPIPDHMKPLDLSSIQFRQLYELVKSFFPSSVIGPPPSEESLNVIQGLYGNISDSRPEPCRFNRFYKFEDAKSQISDSFVKRTASGSKRPGHLLAHDKGSYEFAGPAEDHLPPNANISLSKLLVRNITEKMCISLSLEDARKMESMLMAAQESQSFSMWLIGALLNYIKSTGYTPPDVTLFERICRSFSSAQVRSHAFMLKLQAFLTMNRRNLYLAHAPPSLGTGQKRRLLSETPFGRDLFNEETLDTVIKEHQGDVNASTNQNLARAISSAFSGKKRKVESSSSGEAQSGSPLVDPKASASGSSASSVARRWTNSRGRGRGGRGRGSGGKLKVNPRTSGNSGKNFQN